MDALHWRVAPGDWGQVTALQRASGLCRPIALVLANRGIAPDQVEAFLRPRLTTLSDPFLLPGVEVAAARLWRAVHERERILVHGDYDTDGITATVLLTWVLREHGATVEAFLPHRINDGYGLTTESIEKAVAERYHLLITVDCGITSVAAAALAREKGLDVIITDHHQPGADLPPALAVINPKLHPQLAALQVLAGVGVAFKLCHGFLKYGREHGLGGNDLDLREGMDLVALGTVADIVPLLGENRTLVRHGMKTLTEQRRPGLRALCDIAGLNEQLAASDIAFRLAPRLNAAGRMGDAEDALKLLQAPTIVEAYNLAANLDACNRRRQTQEEQVFQAALAQLEGYNLQQRFSIVVQGDAWHRGVIGIVASRLTQTYHRPSIVLTFEEGDEGHGSGRSVEGVDLIAALDQCRTLLSRYGGHPMATGLSLPRAHLPAFAQAFEDAVRGVCGDVGRLRKTLAVAGDAALDEMTATFFDELAMLQPFGHGHAPPVYRFLHLTPERLAVVGRNHLRGEFRDDRGQALPFIAFNRRREDVPAAPCDVAATPQLNRFRGTVTPQLQVHDLRPSG